jgi:hypothetical protein
MLTLRNIRLYEIRTPPTRPGGRDAHEVIAASQKITVAALLTMSDATGSMPSDA